MCRHSQWFQSSPGPKAGCYVAMHMLYFVHRKFQSSPGPKAGCYTTATPEQFNAFAVSILTRPESRMLLAQMSLQHLTHIGFNPHPARKPDATALQQRWHDDARRCFNPHPARKPDATIAWLSGWIVQFLFQSSPGPKAGCYCCKACHQGRIRQVSILTRPESRMLLAHTCYTASELRFQSSPGPKAGCYASFDEVYRVQSIVSILTRPESRMLRLDYVTGPPITDRFQSSPGPKAGCYCVGPTGKNENNGVSILTRPESRMLPPRRRHRRISWEFQSSPGPKAGCYWLIVSAGSYGL